MAVSRVLLRLVLVFVTVCPNALGQKNNVCKHFVDYATLLVNPNCWYNIDVNSNTMDMIIRNGYQAEEYPVETEDGYTLSLYRIPRSNKTTRCTCTHAVFIQYGLEETSEVWTDKEDRSLGDTTDVFSAFYLSDRCYDVWMGNYRESPHTLKHRKYKRKDPQFWNNSWHEMGLYDIPANLNFIKSKIGRQRKILYVGISMGATSSLVYQILKPSEAKENIQGAVFMAPAVFLNHMRSPVFTTSAKFWRQIQVFVKVLHLQGMLKDRFLQQILTSTTCSKFPLMYPCILVFFLIHGIDFKNFLAKDVPLIVSYNLASTAYKTVNHYYQVRDSGEFQMYDYQSRNVEVYGRKRPPKYDLTKITIPTHLFYGSKDFFVDKQDVEKLYREISSVKKSITGVDYNHYGFVYSKDLKTNLYPKLLEKLESMKSESCE